MKSVCKLIAESREIAEKRNRMTGKTVRIRIGNLLIRSDEILHRGAHEMSSAEVVDLFTAFVCIVSGIEFFVFEKVLAYHFPVIECVECGRLPYDECPQHGKEWVRGRGNDQSKTSWSLTRWQAYVSEMDKDFRLAVDSSPEQIVSELRVRSSDLYQCTNSLVFEYELCKIFVLILRVGNRLNVDIEREMDRVTAQVSQYAH